MKFVDGEKMKSIEEKILEAVKKSDGLTIEEVSKKVNIHRITASKYLAVLDAKNLVKYRTVGKAKMYFKK